jgi:DNA-binding transcriptional MerR regulator
MLKIGEFSRFGQVTVKTLRHYDRIGLLKPVEVDRFTGYRYYSASQLGRLNRILALKGLGLALEQIQSLLDEALSPDEIRGMLKLKQAEIEDRLQEQQDRLARVELRLRQIEKEESMSDQEVVIKKASGQSVMYVRDTVSTAGIGQLFGELFGYLGQQGVSPAGPPFAIYYDEEFREDALDVEVTAPVAKPLPETERVKSRDMEAIDELATVIHEGSYDTIGGTYSHLLSWIEANGYRPGGPVREIYLRGPGEGADPSDYVTEVQMPLAKIS